MDTTIRGPNLVRKGGVRIGHGCEFCMAVKKPNTKRAGPSLLSTPTSVRKPKPRRPPIRQFPLLHALNEKCKMFIQVSDRAGASTPGVSLGSSIPERI